VEAKQPDDLVERMQGGDVDAFEEFFNTYKRPIYATALAITRDPFLAEEVLQDCFVKAYRVRERLDPARSPLPWLQRVTINLCYSRVSRRKALSEPLTNLTSWKPRLRPSERKSASQWQGRTNSEAGGSLRPWSEKLLWKSFHWTGI